MTRPPIPEHPATASSDSDGGDDVDGGGGVVEPAFAPVIFPPGVLHQLRASPHQTARSTERITPSARIFATARGLRYRVTSMNELRPALEDDHLYEHVTAIFDEARSRVARTVNTAMVHAYWFIGREIVEVSQQAPSARGTATIC